MEADGIFLFALEGLRRLMNNHYVFSETKVNADELQQYREESDSVLSFVKDYCELNPGYSAVPQNCLIPTRSTAKNVV